MSNRLETVTQVMSNHLITQVMSTHPIIACEVGVCAQRRALALQPLGHTGYEHPLGAGRGQQ